MIDEFHNLRTAIAPMTVISVAVAVGLYVAPQHAGASLGQQDVAVVHSSLTAGDVVNVGDTVRYNVIVESPPGADVTFDSPDDDSRWTEIDRQIETDAQSNADTATTEATLQYAIYRPGPTSGPPIEAGIQLSGDAMDIELPSYDVDVESIIEDGDTLAGPGGPRALVDDISPVVWLAIGGSTVAVALALFIAARRRDPYGDIEAPAPPHQRAHQALEALADSSLLAEGRFKVYYIRLSGILRSYLGERFGFPGTELTTTEISTHFDGLDDDRVGSDADAVIEWLQACDRVKFAGYTPSVDEATQHLDEAFAILESTAPAPDPEEDTMSDDDDTEGASNQTPARSEQASPAAERRTESEPT